MEETGAVTRFLVFDPVPSVRIPGVCNAPLEIHNLSFGKHDKGDKSYKFMLQCSLSAILITEIN
jgi:hypothetical protein